MVQIYPSMLSGVIALCEKNDCFYDVLVKMPGNFTCFYILLLFFLQITFKKRFIYYTRVLNSLDSDRA